MESPSDPHHVAYATSDHPGFHERNRLKPHSASYLFFRHQRSAAGKDRFLVSGRLSVERRKDKAGKEIEAYQINISKALGIAD